MGITRILCPTDYSPGADQAVRVAIRMAREVDAELVLLHAWHIPASAYSLESPLPPQLEQHVVANAQRSLDAVVATAIADGVANASGRLLAGVPWIQIVDELEREAYDLCVIGTSGRTGIARFLLGSVAEKVVRHARCSVLAVRPDSDVKPFHHALVPTDFSESAVHALDLAATLLEPTGSVTLMHVIEGPGTWSGEMPIADFLGALDKHITDALGTEVERFRRTSNLPIYARSRLGAVGAEILAVLDEDRGIDLVVMGSHGRTGIRRALMGSVAEKVVRHARCPVFVSRRRA